MGSEQLRGNGPNGETYSQVDPTFMALRTSVRPQEYRTTDGSFVGGHYAFAATFSNTAATPGAAAQLLSVRWRYQGQMMALLRAYAVVGVTTAFTTAQIADFTITKATAIPNNPSGNGTNVVPTAASQKMRTNLMGQSLLFSNPGDVQITTSGTGLTPGASQILDTQPFGYGSIGCTGVGVAGQVDLFNVRDFGGHPQLFGYNEGFVIQNGIAFGAAGICKIGFVCIFAEVPHF
jgi:hypothetical protein